jgi:YMGG-like Gly-zipper
MPTGIAPVPDRPQTRVLTAAELAYVNQPPLSAEQQAAYLATLRGMTEDRLNAERRRVQTYLHLFQYLPVTNPEDTSTRERRPNHPDFWRSAQISEVMGRRHARSNDVQNTVAGGIIGTAVGAGAGAIMGNYKKGAAIGAVAGAVAPHVSEAARGITQMARFLVALMSGHGPARY